MDKPTSKLQHYMVEILFYLKNDTELCNSEVFNIVTKEDNLDYVYAIAYQKLLESIINSFNIVDKNVLRDEFSVYEIAEDMIDKTVCGNIYTENGNIFETHE